MASKRHVTVGGVQIGGGAPVAVQTMTKTETANLQATMAQIGHGARTVKRMARGRGTFLASRAGERGPVSGSAQRRISTGFDSSTPLARRR